jgi:hypothetical protein
VARGKPLSALEPLRGDFRLPGFFDPGRLVHIGFWLSAAGVRTLLHYDPPGNHNLNAQVRGSKRVTLVAPQHVREVYPFRYALGEFGNYSRVDVARPDLDRFLRFGDAERFEDVIEEGEVLFVPPLWYHAFEHLGETNVNVNFWWRPEHYVPSRNFDRWHFTGVVDAFLDRTGRGSVEELDPAVREFLDRVELSMIERV